MHSAARVSLEDRVSRALDAQDRIFAAFSEAADLLEQATIGKHAYAVPESRKIAERAATDLEYRQRLRAVADRQRKGRDLLRQQREALLAAMNVSVAIDRRQRIYAIPVTLVQEAGRVLLASPAEWDDDPAVQVILSRARAEAMSALPVSTGDDRPLQVQEQTPGTGATARFKALAGEVRRVTARAAEAANLEAAGDSIADSAGQSAGKLRLKDLPEIALRLMDMASELVKELAAPPGPPAPDPAAMAVAFEADLDLRARKAVKTAARVARQAREIYLAAAERMQVVELAVNWHAGKQVTQAPGAEVAMRVAAHRLARTFEEKPEIFRRCQVALQQTVDLRRELYLVDQEIARLEGLDSREQLAAAEGIDLPALKGKAIPLTNFWRMFQG
ncbi:MAG: hypothetical protein FJZ00_13495, partial [Candidatus Sericytochromatia bacterium]|nr:hypothetical protein [Candidatus Tanganyikabacteria bacterium]